MIDIKTASIQEVVEDDQFRVFFNNKMIDVRNARNKVKPGFRIRRGAYETLDEGRMLNLAAFSYNWPLILQKKSSLPASERKWISQFMLEVFQETIAHYTNLTKEEPK